MITTVALCLNQSQTDMVQLDHKCNWLRLPVTCSITITNKQNNNVFNYDCIESNNYNCD